MRSETQLIDLLFEIYTWHEWVEIEEYLTMAFPLLSYHGARFKILADIRDVHEKALKNNLVEEYGYISMWSHKRQSIMDKIQDITDNDPFLVMISKFSDSEEAFSEGINKEDIHRELFGLIAHTYITFKS